ncbi:hypothetical protein MUP65_02290 [Patescibacteria group bacterium]|nr:hypothetical protein [Patescibacteria group bacterium]
MNEKCLSPMRHPGLLSPKNHPHLAGFFTRFFNAESKMTPEDAQYAKYHRHPTGEMGWYRCINFRSDSDHEVLFKARECVSNDGKHSGTVFNAECRHVNGRLFPVEVAVIRVPNKTCDPITFLTRDADFKSQFSMTQNDLHEAVDIIANDGLGEMSGRTDLINEWINTFVGVATRVVQPSDGNSQPLPDREDLLEFLSCVAVREA